jgi:hypothetical protein
MDSIQPFSGSPSCNPADDCPAGYAVRPYQKVLKMGRIIMSEMDHEVLL